MPGLFDDYQGAAFCEVFDRDHRLRPHYQTLIGRLEEIDAQDLSHRTELLAGLFRDQGITFAVAGEAEGIERTWPMDLVPRIIPASEWAHLEEGLIQRVKTLNLFLQDLYTGERAVLKDKVVPGWLVASSPGYLPEVMGITVPHNARCIVSGIDLVRDDEGIYRVLEDNLRVPSGVSYVVENRSAMARILPVAFARHRVRPVAQYGASLLSALRSVAPRNAGEPTIVVLTPGVFNSAYFEHAFLSRNMGVELVEGRDLIVDDHVVYALTTEGLSRVDVIYRRVEDEFLDPVTFRPDSLLGIPGLMSALRAGNVTLANAVGNGVADDKGIYSYVPELIRYYLGEEPVLPNVTTYRPWMPEELDHVLSRLDQLVVKPVAEAGGYGIIIGSQTDEKTLAEVRKRLIETPRGYIAQETVRLSTHPTLAGDHLAPRHIDLRPFVIFGEQPEVLPGGLTRVALREGSLIVNSSQGGGSKDTWVLVEDT
ncbi:MAG TPA: circularly permuted type 2 ATP-grasp protein [Acidimicrobiia bacterium]|nr:circularly permuted type 2 ATP-grasp protein [Acidimicrobiia bacterium]